MRKLIYILFSGAFLFCACSGAIEPSGTLESLPPIEPDYSFVTVPRKRALRPAGGRANHPRQEWLVLL